MLIIPGRCEARQELLHMFPRVVGTVISTSIVLVTLTKILHHHAVSTLQSGFIVLAPKFVICCRLLLQRWVEVQSHLCVSQADSVTLHLSQVGPFVKCVNKKWLLASFAVGEELLVLCPSQRPIPCSWFFDKCTVESNLAESLFLNSLELTDVWLLRPL